MDQREHALSEALHTNEKQKEKWNKYLTENETTIENLEKFNKQLTVDIMVPIGRKALVSGQLIHTNEVLVGHYQNYFTKCSALKAKEICQLRIKMSKEYLQKLEKEAELWQNKLTKPYTDGAFGDYSKREIIEDYNEENEKKWREQHKVNVKKAKLEEKKRREENANENNSNNKSDVEIFQMLEEAELMEELQQELDKLEMNEISDEVIQQLLQDEVNGTGKNSIKRIAHNNVEMKSNQNENVIKQDNEVKKLTENKSQGLINKEPIVKYDKEDDEIDNDEKEISLIKEQAKFLNTTDQVGFYEYQIQIIREKISRQSNPITKDEMNEKIRLFVILDQLEELLEIAEETVGLEELNEKETHGNDVNNNDYDDHDEDSNKVQKSVRLKRRVSFALEDDKIEFDKNVAVTEMLHSNSPFKNEINENLKLTKEDCIQKKVEDNRQYMTEQQSEHDFNLDYLIMRMTTMTTTNTLEIKFKHSQQVNNENSSTMKEQQQEQPCDSNNIGVGKPSDIYDNYMKFLSKSTTLHVNSYETEEDVKMPVLKEEDRLSAFENPRGKFSNPRKAMKQIRSEESENWKNCVDLLNDKKRSILCNKSNVDEEKHNLSPIRLMDNKHNNDNLDIGTKKKRKASNHNLPLPDPDDEDEKYMTAYYKVMNDIIEKPLTEPDPLPAGNFIDAHAPKKRISRFKEMRQQTSTALEPLAL